MKAALLIVTTMLLMSLAGLAASADPVLTLDERVATLEAFHGIDRSTPTAAATVTSEPTGTATTEPTTTATHDHGTATATATATEAACAVSAGASVWHAATNHEHGDAPPAWADAYSCDSFGHPVEFGGDEATPNEEHHKHEAYKGYGWTEQGTNFYARLHLSSLAMDRGVRFHSAEVYARDVSGGVSFWQFHADAGDPETQRFSDCRFIFPALHPLFRTPHGWVSAPTQAAWDSGCRFERWYMRGQDWQPDIVLDIYDPATLRTVGEAYDDPESSWVRTPDNGLGLWRGITLNWYGDDNATGAYPGRNSPTLRGWYCATPQGAITGAVGGPDECESGTLPQHLAPTMPTVKTTAIYTLHPSADGITLPN